MAFTDDSQASEPKSLSSSLPWKRRILLLPIQKYVQLRCIKFFSSAHLNLSKMTVNSFRVYISYVTEIKLIKEAELRVRQCPVDGHTV